MPHTPGPWMPYDDKNTIGIYMRDDDGTCGPQIAEVLLETLEGHTDEQGHADARLIAAAPELLAACKALVAETEDRVVALGWDSVAQYRNAVQPMEAHALAVAAIAKAE